MRCSWSCVSLNPGCTADLVSPQNISGLSLRLTAVNFHPMWLVQCRHCRMVHAYLVVGYNKMFRYFYIQQKNLDIGRSFGKQIVHNQSIIIRLFEVAEIMYVVLLHVCVNLSIATTTTLTKIQQKVAEITVIQNLII